MDKYKEMVFEYNAGDAQAPIFLYEFLEENRSVQLEPIVTGVGYVQASCSTIEAINNNQGAWITWPAGSVSSATQDTINPAVTAVRVYRTSGDLRLTVRLV